MRFQIGVPRVGSAARLAENAEPVARMPLPRAGSAARDAEQRKRLAGEARMPPPVLGLRGTGGRVVSMEEMIAASRSPGTTAPAKTEAAFASQPPASALQRVRPADLEADGSSFEMRGTTASPDAVSTPAAHPAVTITGYPQSTLGGAASRSSMATSSSASPDPPRFSADRVKALVRSLFFRER